MSTSRAPSAPKGKPAAPTAAGGEPAPPANPAAAHRRRRSRPRKVMPMPWIPDGVSSTMVKGLATGGLLMGLITTCVGLRPEVEPYWWGSLFALWLVYLTYRRPQRPFMTALCSGLLCGGYTGVTQAVMFDWYRLSNPWYKEELAGPSSWKMQGLMVAQGLGAGIASGAVTGVLALGLTQLCGGPRKSAATSSKKDA